MQITKFVHACLLVETPERVAIFDPGSFSYKAFDFNKLKRLDDIFITHIHQDHLDLQFVKDLISKFPCVRITSSADVVAFLNTEGINAKKEPPIGVTLFDSPHENVAPLSITPVEVGFHYQEFLTVPGDSHSFHETKEILAIPITAPWGSSIRAINLILELKPKYVIPIHDWHWSDQARTQMYDRYAQVLADYNITMFKPETGKEIDIQV